MTEFRQPPSWPKFVVTDDGHVIGPSGKQLRHFPNRDGYRRVNLYLGASRWQQISVHTLVCEAFHGLQPTPKHVVGHRNGNPADNRAENLRWVTQKQNEDDKRAHGRSLDGARNHFARLSEVDVLAIRASCDRRGVLAERYGVAPETIWSIRTRRSWRNI